MSRRAVGEKQVSTRRADPRVRGRGRVLCFFNFFNEAQLSQQESFREATAYAQSVKSNPVYIQKADALDLTPYNVAVADWFHAPEILEVDLSAWSGQTGQSIHIKAVDDVQVQQVSLVITDENDAVLEQGAATQADSLWWIYTTTLAASGSLKVLASAQDLPGHTAEMTKTK